MIPAARRVTVPTLKLSPTVMPSRSSAVCAIHASMPEGAPTLRSSVSVRLPNIGQLASTAFSSMGAAASGVLAMACIR
jgi:hypothetical protein